MLQYTRDRGIISKRKDGKMKQINHTRRKQRKSFSLAAGLLTAIFIISIAAIPTSAARAAGYLPSGATEEIPITLDGRRILDASAYLIDSTTYVPLRAFCEAIDECDISWDSYSGTAIAANDGIYLTATPGKRYISVNGRYFYTVQSVRNIDGRVYVPIRPMAKAFSLELEWDSESRSVRLYTTGKRTKWASEVYNDDDIYWLARIINSEAGNQPFLGKMAVGNVVLNRVRSSQYPNTIYGVIFDRKHGVQFSPILNGTIYKTPNTESIIAAKICLEGYSLSSTALYFLNPRIATSFWIVNNCTYEFSIGEHDFYR